MSVDANESGSSALAPLQTVFSYSRAVQYHAILHGAGVITRALGLRGILASNHDVL